MSLRQYKRWGRGSDSLKSQGQSVYRHIKLLTVGALEEVAGYPARDTQMMCEPFRRRQIEGDNRALGRWKRPKMTGLC